MGDPIYSKKLMSNIVDKFLNLSTRNNVVAHNDYYTIVFGPYELEVWPDALEEDTVRCYFSYNSKGVCVYDFAEGEGRTDNLLKFCHRKAEYNNNKKIVQDFLDNY